MLFEPTPLQGGYVIEPQRRGDERGFFARVFCQKELAEQGLTCNVVQANNSFSAKARTLRGLHYQLPPHCETKIVRCIRGSIYDVMVDLRPDSSTFGKHFGAELTAANQKMMYVPKGFAHGFITLADDCEVLYLVDEFYSPDRERGLRWNDPFFKVEWLESPVCLSERDAAHPDFSLPRHQQEWTEEQT